MELVSGLTEKYDFLLLVYMFGMMAIQNKRTGIINYPSSFFI